MSDVTATSHLSIGEVLALVQEDFPDVTISKIRFLESQGLIAPERTGSGYRKFYEADIDRLRWILRQQRDHFLPLKVIRKMLDEGVDMSEPVDSQPTLWSSTETEAAVPDVATESPAEGRGVDEPDEARPGAYRSPSHPAVASARRPAPEHPEDDPAAGRGRPSPDDAAPAAREVAADRGREPLEPAATEALPGAVPAPVARSTDTTSTSSDVPAGPVDVVAEGRERAREAGVPVAPDPDAPPVDDPAPDHASASGAPSERPAHSTPADVVAALQEDPRAARRGRRGATKPAESTEEPTPPSDETESAAAAPSAEDPAVTTPPLTALLTAEELCAMCDISQELLDGLEQYGLVVPASLGGRSAYDAEAVDVARLASKYAALGVEPRHLRMYKISAEREAGFVEQLVVPLIKQRNPAAKQQAVARCDDLTAMGAELHAALLRRQLGRILGP